MRLLFRAILCGFCLHGRSKLALFRPWNRLLLSSPSGCTCWYFIANISISVFPGLYSSMTLVCIEVRVEVVLVINTCKIGFNF